jgi:serpin B
MTLEGAEGETARQMGTVLRLPEAARSSGAAAIERPWDTAVLHPGMAALRQRLRGGTAVDPAQAQALRQQIAALEQEHHALTQQLVQLQARELRAQVPDAEHRARQGEVTQRAMSVAGELNRLRQQVDQYELRITNALWGEQTFPFRQAFLDTLTEAYGVAALPADFLHDPEGARGQINRWAAQQRNGRIPTVLAPGVITPATRLVLANAIYFKGHWADQFDSTATQEAAFTRADGTTTLVRLMEAHRSWRYAELLPDSTRNDPVFDRDRFAYEAKSNPDGFQLLALPYRGNTLSMVVMLPKNPAGLPALEERLTADTLAAWLETMRQQQVHVFLPRFTLETAYALPSTLSAMGMPAAFQPGGFTGVSDAPTARLLALSNVVHRAWVKVDEEGTEAAAVTVIGMALASRRIEPPIPTFRADRPFLFLIREQESGAILFLGRMLAPQDAPKS